MTEHVDKPLSVIEADRTDIDWLISSYLGAACSGHFDYDIEDRETLRMIRANLRSIVLQKKMKDFRRLTQTMIFERDGVRIGACVIAQIIGQPTEVELHIMLVDPGQRGNGYGNMMLDEVIGRWHEACDIYVRCYAVSVQMIRMLERRNFISTTTFDDTSTLYLLRRSPLTWQVEAMASYYLASCA